MFDCLFARYIHYNTMFETLEMHPSVAVTYSKLVWRCSVVLRFRGLNNASEWCNLPRVFSERYRMITAFGRSIVERVDVLF